jgi:hypothetical protein
VYFNFNENVYGFDASDVGLTNATLTNFTQISASQYSATVTPVGHGAGTMSFSVGSNSYTDTAGNGGTGDTESQAYQLGRVNLISNGDVSSLSGWETPNAFWSSDNSSLSGGAFGDTVDPTNLPGSLLFTRDAPNNTPGGPGATGAVASVHLETGKTYEWSLDAKSLENGPGALFFTLSITDWDDLNKKIVFLQTKKDNLNTDGGGADGFDITGNWTTLGTKAGTEWTFTGPTGDYKFDIHVYSDTDAGSPTVPASKDVVFDRLFFGETVI